MALNVGTSTVNSPSAFAQKYQLASELQFHCSMQSKKAVPRQSCFLKGPGPPVSAQWAARDTHCHFLLTGVENGMRASKDQKTKVPLNVL